jgi:hypothetical protein
MYFQARRLRELSKENAIKAIEDGHGVFMIDDEDNEAQCKNGDVCWFLPNKRKITNKNIFEMLVHLMEMNTRDVLSNNKKGYDSKANKSDIDMGMVHFLKGIISLLEWIINSTSWADGELHGFDLFEIKNKLEKTGGHLR